MATLTNFLMSLNLNLIVFLVFDWLCSRCLVQNNSNKNLLKVQIIGLIKQF